MYSIPKKMLIKHLDAHRGGARGEPEVARQAEGEGGDHLGQETKPYRLNDPGGGYVVVVFR